MSFRCLQFLPKNERKQVDLRYHNSKVEFVCSFFGRILGLKKSLRLCLTFKGGLISESFLLLLKSQERMSQITDLSTKLSNYYCIQKLMDTFRTLEPHVGSKIKKHYKQGFNFI